jgi:hypothetical protein
MFLILKLKTLKSAHTLLEREKSLDMVVERVKKTNTESLNKYIYIFYMLDNERGRSWVNNIYFCTHPQTTCRTLTYTRVEIKRLKHPSNPRVN